jgi:hypothetical protein
MNPVISVEVFHSAFDAGFAKVAEFANNVMMGVNQELERAFRYTNSIEEGWWKNPEVTNVGPRVLKDGGARSTSVGDYMLVSYADGSQEWYVVAGFGFEKVEDDTVVEYEGYNYYKGQVLSRYGEEMPFAELRASKANYDPKVARMESAA